MPFFLECNFCCTEKNGLKPRCTKGFLLKITPQVSRIYFFSPDGPEFALNFNFGSDKWSEI